MVPSRLAAFRTAPSRLTHLSRCVSGTATHTHKNPNKKTTASPHRDVAVVLSSQSS